MFGRLRFVAAAALAGADGQDRPEEAAEARRMQAEANRLFVEQVRQKAFVGRVRGLFSSLRQSLCWALPRPFLFSQTVPFA